MLYTKEGCSLCRGVRNSLEELRWEFDLVVDEVEITRDSGLYERYKERVPVVIIDGRVILEGRISEEQIRRALWGSIWGRLCAWLSRAMRR